MEYKKFNFDPEDGFLNEDFYEETPENSREILQRQHSQTRDYINSLIDTLNSDKEGSSGSESIKSPEIEGVSGNNVFSQLKDMKKQINESMEGIIPDGSVTEIKLSQGAVTEEKIAKGAITTEKMAGDTIAPYANDVININGVSKDNYLPVSLTGNLSFLRELFAKGVPQDLYGKYFNNKRYMFKNQYLHTLDMETGEFTKISDFVFPLKTRIIPDEGDFIYVYLTKDSENYIHIHIAKYIKEYDTGEELRDIRIYSNYESPQLLDIFNKDGYLYIGTVNMLGNADYYYIYKIDEKNILEDNPVIYYSDKTDNISSAFFPLGQDIVLGKLIFKNGDTENKVVLNSYALCEDGAGNILVDNYTLPVIDGNTYLPKCANLCNTGYLKRFLYKNYIYVLVEDYLFKTRLF